MSIQSLMIAFNLRIEGYLIIKNFNLIVFAFFVIIVAKAQDKTENLDLIYEKGYEHFYINKDSALFYFDLMETYALDDIESIIDAKTAKAEVLEYHRDLSELDSTLIELDSLFKTHYNFITNVDDGIFYRVHFAYQKGNYYYITNRFEKSRVFFNEIINIIEQQPKKLMDVDLHTYLSTAYGYLAKMYSNEGKLNLARKYYERNIRNLKKNNSEDKSSLHANYNLLAEVLKRQKNYEEANSFLFKTYRFNIKNSKDNDLLTVLNIAQNYNSLSQSDSAKYYVNIARSLLKKNDPEESSFYQVSAETQQKNGNYDLALKEFQKALTLVSTNWGGNSSFKKAHILNKIGLLQNQYQYYHKALNTYDKAILLLSNSSSENSQNKLFQVYRNKAIVLNTLNTSESHLSAFNTTDLSIKILDDLKTGFLNNNDKLRLIENAFPLFESGLIAAHSLYESSKNDYYIEEAFRYFEKSKSVLLLEALLSSQATTFAKIPKEKVTYENQLKSEITNIEKELSSSRNIEVGLEDKLFNLRQEHINLIVDLETNYPAYYDLKYNNKIQTLPEVQDNLTENDLFISYFYGNQNIYTIAISKNDKFFHSITITEELENHISELHAMLSNAKSNPDSLSKLSHKLYQKILGPILKLHPQERIILAPDGLLNYIPFGSLVTNERERRYLIEDKIISYVNSATLWTQLNGKKQNSAKLLAFAPSFDANIPSDDSRSQLLGNLPHNRNEVQQILTSFTGKSFIDDQATLQNFTATLSDYSVLHLATHAVFDDKNPEYSYLAFTPNTASDDLLFVKDLYNLTLNASLVTLSGCESGIGELKRGEGFLSLARGFFYSGAASITSTLWKINDNSSSDLMGDFYLNLADGKAKDESLREAKLTFLEKNKENGLSHPYWWSGYIIQGNTKPLVSSSKWQWILYGSIVILLLFLGRKQLVQLFK